MPRNATVLICAVASLSVKYQCPLDARVKPDTSPTTHTDGNARSTAPRTCAVSCETVSVTGAASWGAALMLLWDRPLACRAVRPTGCARGKSDRPADRAY